MRKWWLIIIMCFFLYEVNAGRKALLVGISKYPQNSGWREISSSNDLELLASMLQKYETLDGQYVYEIVNTGTLDETPLLQALQPVAKEVPAFAGDDTHPL